MMALVDFPLVLGLFETLFHILLHVKEYRTLTKNQSCTLQTTKMGS